MSKQVIFHIGYPKTGTSYLQEILEDKRNNNFFKSKKVGYTRCIFKTNYLDEVKFIDNCDVKELRDIFRNWFEKTKLETFLVSNEAYIHISPSGIKRLKDSIKEFAAAKVIIYIRRQDLICESSWKQWGVKHYPFDVEYKKFISEGLMYSKLLDAWAEVFGSENLIVRIHDKEKLKKGIAFDFFNALGINIEGLVLPTKAVNTGFDMHTLNMLYMSRSLMRDTHDNILNNLFSKYGLGNKEIFSNYQLLSQEQRQNIIEFHEKDNNYVLKKYFDNKFQYLFSKPLVNSEDQFEGKFKTNLEDVVPILVGMILGQEKRIDSLERRYDGLKNNKAVKVLRKLKFI